MRALIFSSVTVCLAAGALILLWLAPRWSGNSTTLGKALPFSVFVQPQGTSASVAVILNIDTTAPTSDEAVAANDVKTADVIAAIKALDLADADIHTTPSLAAPVMASTPDGNQQTSSGYRATNALTVNVAGIQDVGRVVQAGIQAELALRAR